MNVLVTERDGWRGAAEEDAGMATINLTESETATWESGDERGQRYRESVRTKATATVRETGATVEIVSHDGITLDAISRSQVETRSIEEDEEMASYKVGDYVQGGETDEDRDVGRVLAVDGKTLTIAWSSGVRTQATTDSVEPATATDWRAHLSASYGES